MSKTNLERDELLAEAQRLINKPNFSREDASRAQSLISLADSISPVANELRKMRMAAISAEMGIADPAHAQLYRLTQGVTQLPEVERHFLTALRFGRDHVPQEVRALSAAIGANGGFLVPESLANAVYSSMKAFDAIFSPDVSTVIDTGTGNAPMRFVVSDDTAGTATKIPEGQQVTPSDSVTFGQVSLMECDTWRSSIQAVSMELIDDSAFDVGAYLAYIFGQRLARSVGADFVATLLSSASVGKTGTTGQTTTVIYDDLIDLVGSVDPAYIASPKCGFAMRFSTLLSIMKLKASTGGSPMLSFDAGRFMLLGKPVFLCPSVPAMAASAKSILFGDFSKFVVRRVADGVEIKRYNELYATGGMIGFQAFLRVKAALAIAAGSDSPIKWYANSAT